MDKDEKLHKELDLIQNIISRMGQNSFQVKAWLMGILGVMLALTNESLLGNVGSYQKALVIDGLLLLPIFMFWYLDAFFLSTEKLYRELYKWVIQHRPNTELYLYDLNTFKRTVTEVEEDLNLPANGIWPVMKSKTLRIFYGVPLLIVVGLIAYNTAGFYNVF